MRRLNLCVYCWEDVNTKRNDGMTPLFAAVANGKIEIVRLILERKPKINTIVSMFGSALHLAVFSHKPEIAKDLINSGIDTDMRNADGKTAFEIALENDDTDVQKLLRDKANFLKIQRFKACELKNMTKDLHVIGNCAIIKNKIDNVDLELIASIKNDMSKIGYYCTYMEYEENSYQNVIQEIHALQQFGEVFFCIVLSGEEREFFKTISQNIVDPNVAVYFINNTKLITLKRFNSRRQAWFLFDNIQYLLSTVEYIVTSFNDLNDISLYSIEHFVSSNHGRSSTVYIDEECAFISVTNIEYSSKLHSKESDEEEKRRKIQYEMRATTGTIRLFQQVNTAGYRWYARIPEKCDFEQCSKNVFQCLIGTGQAKPPRLMLSITADKTLSSQSPCYTQLNRQMQLICSQTDSWLITDGHSFGVSGLLKKNDVLFKTSVIGITSWQSYYDMQFDGSHEFSVLTANCLEDPLSKYFLHPNHTHFIFYDEITNKTFHKENLLVRRRTVSQSVTARRISVASENIPQPSCCGETSSQQFLVPPNAKSLKTVNSFKSPEERRLKIELGLLDELKFLNHHSTVFLKVVHGSKSSVIVELMKSCPDIPVIIVVDTEEAKQEAINLQNTAKDLIVHTTCAENVGVIAELYVSLKEDNIRKIKKDCSRHEEYRRLFYALIESDIEKLDAVDWNFAIKTKGQISRLIPVALKSRLAVRFIETFYEQGYNVSDILDKETMKDIYSIHFKERSVFDGEYYKRKKMKRIGEKIKAYSGNNLVNIYDYKKNKDRLSQNVRGERLYTELDLFLWALVRLQFDLAKVFWRYGQNQVQLAILAVGLIKSMMAEYKANGVEKILTDVFSKEISNFEKMASALADHCSIADELLNSTVSVCNDHTVLYLATQYECENFLISPACIAAMEKLWRTKPPKHSCENDASRCKGIKGSPVLEKQSYCRTVNVSAQIKFWCIFVSHILFLLLMSIIALLYFEVEKVHPLEYVALVWIFDLGAIEFTQIKRNCDSYGFTKGLRSYFWSYWNTIDFLNFVIFIFAGLVRSVIYINSSGDSTADLEGKFLCARISLNIGIFLLAIRTIQYFDAIKKLRQTANIAFCMLTENVSRVVPIYVCFLIGFGVLVGAMKRPYEVASEEKFRMIFHYTFWQLLGDPSLAEFESTPPPQHQEDFSTVYHKGSSYVVLISAALFLLTTNILFLNLLIAMFGHTYTEIAISSRRIWAIQQFIFFYETEKLPILPPPFAMLSLIFSTCLKRKCKHKRKCYALAINHSKEDRETLADYYRKGVYVIDLKALIDNPDTFKNDLNDKRNVTVSTLKDALKEMGKEMDKVNEEVDNKLALILRKISQIEDSVGKK